MPAVRAWPATRTWWRPCSDCRRCISRARLPEQLQAFGIAGGGAGLLQKLMRSHPPLEERIAALRAARTQP